MRPQDSFGSIINKKTSLKHKLYIYSQLYIHFRLIKKEFQDTRANCLGIQSNRFFFANDPNKSDIAGKMELVEVDCMGCEFPACG